MKVLFLLGVLIVAVSTLPIEERIHGENGWYVPQEDGSFEWLDLQTAEDMLNTENEITERISTNPVTFYLYTNSNPKRGQVITTNTKSITESHFNKDHPTRFVIHGWTKSCSDKINTLITAAWLSKGEYNMIAVDWGRARTGYVSAVMGVSSAGEKVGKMIKYLHDDHGMSYDSLDVIGHSLGAHVAGYAGKTVGSGLIHTIIGLDPAMPLFSYDKPETRLNSGDAYYVESITTNGGVMGFLQPIGRAAFYPNGGKSQPGCGIIETGSCSHERAVIYYVEAVRQDNFSSIKCANYEDAVNKSCGSTYSSVRMGATSNSYDGFGDFYVPVNSKSPYGKLD